MNHRLLSPRSRLARRLNDERGSLVFAILLIMLTLTIGATLTASTVMTQRAARQGVNYATAVEGADAGVQHAIAQLNTDGTVTPPAQPLRIGDTDVTYTATQVAVANRPRTYDISALATNINTGAQRRVVARVEEEPRFPFAVFSDESIDFNGGNVIDSYASGVTCTVFPACAWASPYQGLGIAATNEDLTFNGNATANGVALYDWAAYQGTGGVRCTKNGSGVNPCTNQQLKNERLNLLAASESQFISDMETRCDDNNKWQDFRASTFSSGQVPLVLTPPADFEHYCFNFVDFDIETILAPLVLPLDVKPVIIVIKQGGTFKLGTNGPAIRVNCALPCAETTSAPQAVHLQIYSLTTASMDIDPHNKIAAAMYLPAAQCQTPGNGNGTAAGVHIFGSLICKTLTQVGGWNLHYDVALAGMGNGRFLVREWREEPV